MSHPAHIAFYFIGASLALSFLSSAWGGSATGWLVVVVAGSGATALQLGMQRLLPRVGIARWLGRACLVSLIGLYAFWLYLAVAFGWLLSWTLSSASIVAVCVLALAAVATRVRSMGAFRAPAVLPLGLWIALLLSGWVREETLTRCDDYLSVRPPVEIAVPTAPQLDSCRAGEVRRSGRFPRIIWQQPDSDRVVFSTQGASAPGGPQGSVCEAWLDSSSALRCVGRPQGKAQALIEVRERNLLLAMQYGLDTPQGTRGGVVMELPLSDPIEILAEHWFDEHVGEGFYDASSSTLYMYSDRMNGIHPAALPSFERSPTIPLRAFSPGETKYDQARGEGVACGSPSGVAITGDPFAARYLAADRSTPLGLLPRMTWGCDWDPETRDVYVATPNLGLLLRIDYDTGVIERSWFVGLGMRSVEYDPARRRVYLTNFLRGTVSAFDEKTERIVSRWFVGRYSRWVMLTRDGSALLASGNMGIARIALAAGTSPGL